MYSNLNIEPIIPPSNSQLESAPPPVPNARKTPPPPTVASNPARPIPLPIPSNQEKASSEHGNLMKLALLSVKNKKTEQVLEKSNSPSFRGPKGRADLFSQIIKHTLTVTTLYVELQRAQDDLAHLKRTQESAQYEQASQATRDTLDRNRATFNSRAQEAKRRLDRALSTLIDLPDFAKNHIPMLKKETIESYIAELEEWFADIEQHKRILMEREEEKAGLPPGADGSIEPQLTARQLLDRDTGKWSWDDMRNVANELDSRILTASEHFYSHFYTTIADFEDQAAGLEDPRPPINPLTTTTTKTQLDVVSSNASVIGEKKNVLTQVNQVAELLARSHALEQEREQLKNEIRVMNKFCDEAEVHFSQFEQWRKIDEAKIQQLSEQLQTLHLHYKSPPKTSSIPTMTQDEDDDMISKLRPIVVHHLKKEAQPIFDALRNRCLEDLERSKNVIDELVTPALVMTDDIRQRVSTLS